jgi:hypothetical protein
MPNDKKPKPGKPIDEPQPRSGGTTKPPPKPGGG